MSLNKKELENLVPQNNYVLLTPIDAMDTIELAGEKIYVDTTYKPEHHQKVVNRVVKLPEELVFSKRPFVLNSMEWETEQQLKVGDIVICHYLQIIKANKIKIDGQEYVFLPYEYIFCAVRRWDHEYENKYLIFDDEMFKGMTIDISKIIGTFAKTGSLLYRGLKKEPVLVDSKNREIGIPDDVIVTKKQVGKYKRISYLKLVMLNGYILFKGVPAPQDPDLWTPRRNKERYGVVKHIGIPNTQYRFKGYYDDDFITVGQVIHTHFMHYKKLEHSLHSILSEVFYIAQRRFILGVFQK